MPNQDLTYTINLNNQQTKRAAGEVEDSLKRVGRAGAQAGNEGSHGIQRLTRSLMSSLGPLMSMVALAGALSFGQAIKESVMLAANYESTSKGMAALVGSAEKANKILVELEQFAKESPLGFNELTEASRRMLAFQFRAEEVVPALKAISAATGALNTGTVGLDRIVLALGQMKMKGHVAGEELRQLNEAGIAASSILAKGFGDNTEHFLKMVEKGAVPAEEAIKILLAGMQKQFGAAAKANATTLTVTMSNTLDNLKTLGREVGNVSAPPLRAALEQLRPMIENAGKWVKEHSEDIRNWAEMIAKLGAVFVTGRILWTLGQIPLLITSIGTSMQALAAASAANPWGLFIMGLAALGWHLWESKKRLEDMSQAVEDTQRRACLLDEIKTGKSVKELEKLGYTAAEVKKALSSKDANLGGFDASQVDVGVKVVDGVKAAAEATAKYKANLEEQARLVKQQAEQLARLREQWKDHLQKLADETQASEIAFKTSDKTMAKYETQMLSLHRTITDLGEAHKGLFKINPEEAARAQRLIAWKILWEQLGEAQKLVSDSNIKRWKEEEDQLERKDAATRAHYTTYLNLLDETLAREKSLYAARQFESLDESRDLALAKLDTIQAVTLDQQLDTNTKRLALQRQYLGEREKLEQAAAAEERDRNAVKLREAARLAGRSTDEADAYSESLRLRQTGAIRDKFRAQQEIEEVRSAARASDLIRQHWTTVYDGFKRSAEGVFDALLTKGQSIWSALANSLKTAVLTAIKEVVTSRVALMMMRLLHGEDAANTVKPMVAGRLGALATLAGLGGALVAGNTGAALATAAVTANPAALISTAVAGNKTNAGNCCCMPGLSSGTGTGVLKMLGGGNAVREALAPLTGQVTSSIKFGESVADSADAAARSVIGSAGVVGESAAAAIKTAELASQATDAAGTAVLDGIQNVNRAQRALKLLTGIGGDSASEKKASGGLLGQLLGGSEEAQADGTVKKISALAQLKKNLKNFTGQTGQSVQWGGKSYVSGVGAMGKLTGFLKSDAAALGGGLLALDGFKRGGVTGMAELAGGGALIGAKYGGPIGMAIGAIAGAGIGLINIFRGKPEDRVKKEIQKAYGITIGVKGILTQIAGIAKNSFGGDVTLAVRSPQVRELVELYAASTGVNMPGNYWNQARQTTLMQSGGGISTAPTFSAYGVAMATPGSVFGSNMAAPAAGGTNVTLSLSPQQTLSVFEGRSVQGIARQPGLIARAASSGFAGNVGRTQAAAALISPTAALA